MNQLCMFAAPSTVAIAAFALPAQPEFHTLGPPHTAQNYRATDISHDGRFIVGLDGVGGVWRWEHGVGVSTMPTLLATGFTTPCQVDSAFITADGMRVRGVARRPFYCSPYLHARIYNWYGGQNPTVANDFPTDCSMFYTVSGMTAAGAIVGSYYQTGYTLGFVEGLSGTLSNNLQSVPPCFADDWAWCTANNVTPDGLALCSFQDCLYSLPGAVWRGGSSITRLAQRPVAGSWGAARLVSTTSVWSAETDWTPVFAPGSVVKDISWDGRVIVGNVSVGPTLLAGYVTEGATYDLRTALLAAGVPGLSTTTLESVTSVSGDGRWVIGMARLATGEYQAYTASLPNVCGDIDFNNDGLFPDVMDIDALITAMQGNVCSPPCDSIDFNNDGLYPDTLDIDAFLRVFSGGTCF